MADGNKVAAENKNLNDTSKRAASLSSERTKSTMKVRTLPPDGNKVTAENENEAINIETKGNNDQGTLVGKKKKKAKKN